MPVKKEVSKVAAKKKSVILTPSGASGQALLSETKDLKTKKQESGDSSATPQNDKKTLVRANLSIPVYSLAGREDGTLALPKEIFGQKVNKVLLTQAVRVYAANQKSLTGSTKTRGEVEGSTAKIFRQKGTGRARHGAIRAPIFVGGGIALGPKPRKVILDMPKKMKKVALIAALSSKLLDKNILGISGIDKATGKTKEMADLMYQVSSMKYEEKDKKTKKSTSTLIVLSEKADNVTRGVRNIPGVRVLPVNMLNAYEVLKHKLLLLTKEAVEKLSKPQVKEEK